MTETLLWICAAVTIKNALAAIRTQMNRYLVRGRVVR
jgi:hypothetical protein